MEFCVTADSNIQIDFFTPTQNVQIAWVYHKKVQFLENLLFQKLYFFHINNLKNEKFLKLFQN